MTPSWSIVLTWLTQLSTWPWAHRKHNEDLQLIATRWVPWPHCRQRYSTYPNLFRIATRQHLGHQAIVVGSLIPRVGALKRVPAIGKELLEDTPVPRGWWHHRVAPS